jgi:hypothetical protein
MVGRRLGSLLFAAVAAACAAAGASAVTDLPGIRSPSGNIACLFVPAARGGHDTLLCHIGRADYSAALQRRCISPPTSLDWHGFSLGATGKGAVVCSGGILYNPDTQRPRYTTLAYGRVWRHKAFLCSSHRDGMTCTNRAGHGLFISRERWRAW